MKSRLLYSISFFLLLGQAHAQTQNQIALHWILADSASIEFNFPKLASDSADAEQLISGFLLDTRKKGFLTANIDGIRRDTSQWEVDFYSGGRFEWINLKVDDVPVEILRKSGFRPSDFKGREVDVNQYLLLLSQLQKVYAEQGYPRAKPYLFDLNVEGKGLSASLKIESGSQFSFDTLKIIPDAFIGSRFLGAYLGISPGKVFEESMLARANQRLFRLPFVEVLEAPDVELSESKARPVFKLQQRKINQADGILGLLPNEVEPDRVLLTGQVNLQLHNLFQSGKYFGLEWQRMRPESQLLNIEVEYPNILLSPIGVGAQFYLLKEDTSFLNTQTRLELGYLFGKGESMQFVTGNKRGSLLNTTNVEGVFEQDLADTRYNYYGVELSSIRLDEPIHPFRGYRFDLAADIGNRRIIPNANLPADYYDGLDERSITFSIQWDAHAFVQMGRTSTLAIKFNGGHLYNKNLFLNELFRLGGLRTLRGFNENFFFASTYVVSGIEPRFYFEEGSYFFLFYDQAYVKYQLRMSNFEDLPMGIGGGLSFTTQAGVFSLVYGLGNSKAQKFDFNNSKIHVGYTGRF